jgi:hypothetical protein
MLPCDGVIQRALFWLASDQTRSFTVAAFQHSGKCPHIEAALHLSLVIAMTSQTLFMEEGRYATHEQLFGIITARLGWQDGSDAKEG